MRAEILQVVTIETKKNTQVNNLALDAVQAPRGVFLKTAKHTDDAHTTWF